jgi:zinc transporter
MHESGLILAILLDRKGGGKHLDWDEIPNWKPEEGILWLHFDYSHPDGRQWISGESGLHEIAAEALITEETRPRTTTILTLSPRTWSQSGSGLIGIE